MQKTLEKETNHRIELQNKADEHFQLAQRIENRAIQAENKLSKAEQENQELIAKLSRLDPEAYDPKNRVEITGAPEPQLLGQQDHQVVCISFNCFPP